MYKSSYIPKYRLDDCDFLDVYKVNYNENEISNIISELTSKEHSIIFYDGVSMEDFNSIKNRYNPLQVVNVEKKVASFGELYSFSIVNTSASNLLNLLRRLLNGDSEVVFDIFNIANAKLKELNDLKLENENNKRHINEFDGPELDAVVRRITSNSIMIEKIENDPITRIYKTLLDSISLEFVESVEISTLCDSSKYSDVYKIFCKNRKIKSS